MSTAMINCWNAATQFSQETMESSSPEASDDRDQRGRREIGLNKLDKSIKKSELRALHNQRMATKDRHFCLRINIYAVMKILWVSEPSNRFTRSSSYHRILIVYIMLLGSRHKGPSHALLLFEAPIFSCGSRWKGFLKQYWSKRNTNSQLWLYIRRPFFRTFERLTWYT